MWLANHLNFSVGDFPSVLEELTTQMLIEDLPTSINLRGCHGHLPLLSVTRCLVGLASSGPALSALCPGLLSAPAT
jgi:hypothetical protein